MIQPAAAQPLLAGRRGGEHTSRDGPTFRSRQNAVVWHATVEMEREGPDYVETVEIEELP